MTTDEQGPHSLNDRVGLRGDLRYFRALVDEEKREGGYFNDYGYWRVAVGVTFGFPRDHACNGAPRRMP